MTTHKGFTDHIEGWLGYIPGIGSYRTREKWRETDHKLRAKIAEELQEIKSGLEKVILDLARAKKLDLLLSVDEVVSQLQKMADSIKFAPYGYTGIFDLKKIREDDLKKIYEIDLTLIEDIKKMKALMEGIKKIDILDKLIEEISELKTSLFDLEKKFHQRHAFLSQ